MSRRFYVLRKRDKTMAMSDQEVDEAVAATSKTADETMRLALDTLDRGLAEVRTTRRTAKRLSDSVRNLDLAPRRLAVVKK